MQAFEKLASFYLGRVRTPDGEETSQEPLLYDAKDLTTHALCVGMTGSGKTGLCVGLLEEAALDGIPAIVIDPKGDMGNLLLAFPELAPADFRPWIDESAASREGVSADAYAEKMAGLWRKGLGEWGQDGERIRRLRESADFAIYTPGSNAGLPLTVLRSFDAPPKEVLEDSEAFGDRIEGAAAGLLALAGIRGDPSQSREHVLLANLLRHAWLEGRGLSLVDVIGGIQKPPFERLGVLDLESFYPAKERFKLAMSLNNLLASPSFASWLEGEPLDVQRLLWTPEGRPRVSVLSIAHLSDDERMFFVSSLLHETLAWMRRQSGSSSLRALLYMDEIFGFFPPTANPPSKKPMLLLLKQARAFGLGVVLATQNPVDLDYKGLSNIGTWFLGRLQTEQDKARVLDGLESASAEAGGGWERSDIDRMLSSLGKRVFLMSNVHENRPVAFQTRWAMSYLRGPLNREHVEALMAPRKAALPPPKVRRSVDPGHAPVAPQADVPAKPVVPSGIEELYLEPSGGSDGLLYKPALYGKCKLHYARVSFRVDEWYTVHAVLPLDPDLDDVEWEQADLLEDVRAPRFDREPEDGALHAELPAEAQRKRVYATWRKELKSWLYAERPMLIRQCKALKLTSRPEESEGDFRIRVTEAARERRDEELDKLRKRFGKKIKTVEERIRKADEKVEREEDQLSEKRRDSWLSMGGKLLGAIFGRKLFSSSSARRASSSASKISKEKGDVKRAKADLKARRHDLEELERELEQAVEELEDKWHPRELELIETELSPRKSDIDVDGLHVAWLPWRLEADGSRTPAFELQ
ncbi:MAG: DUF87 domain-containing protein [Planctomycetota bacterium]